ncbi:G protein pathway suppressor 2 isoform X6 [Carcharodon carcharias]|uniref:G protein pathway suppressor 2 isoform X6 n=1 Tax=Carcharodon carcharias TaxID=13397 RepID=UPI001B7F26E9|nr:G protein pathway suppressor 2 isoform X6 [Carcharodon carcharias]
MPALLERPKMSSAMARALHQHIMKERARKRQEEEEVDKMMEQKMKEEQERKRKKEMEERMSLEETKEQISKMELKLQSLQEEKHQLFLQLKKVLHEEEKRRAKMKEQRYKRLFCLKASGPTVITLAKRFFGCKVLWNILRVVKHCRHKQPPSRTLRYHRQARYFTNAAVLYRAVHSRYRLDSQLHKQTIHSTRLASQDIAVTQLARHNMDHRTGRDRLSPTPVANSFEGLLLSRQCLRTSHISRLRMLSMGTSPLNKASFLRVRQFRYRNSWNMQTSSPDSPILLVSKRQVRQLPDMPTCSTVKDSVTTISNPPGGTWITTFPTPLPPSHLRVWENGEEEEILIKLSQ